MENKELNKLLEELWDSLTDEQKEKAKSCKSIDEFMKLTGEEKIELPDEMLDAVSGGYLYRSNDPRTKMPWQVLDPYSGDVITSFATYDEAYEYADKNHYGTTIVTWDEIQKAREDYQLRKEQQSKGC